MRFSEQPSSASMEMSCPAPTTLRFAPDLLSRKKVGTERPQAIDQFLAVMDDTSNYPVLIHCKAGLHRTGCMVAVYRMEYQGWSAFAALNEAKANGFGEFAGSAANDYIMQYITTYEPGQRRSVVTAELRSK